MAVAEGREVRRRRLQRELEAIRRNVSGALHGEGDALALVEAVHAIHQEVNGLLDLAVAEARDDGFSWAEIGMALDLEREQVAERFS